jgi:hypothetical protein
LKAIPLGELLLARAVLRMARLKGEWITKRKAGLLVVIIA